MARRDLLLLVLLFQGLTGLGQVTLDVEPLDIRPAGEDFAPVLTDSGLVFTSIRARAQAITYTDAITEQPLADLYHVRLKNGKPGHPRLLDGSLCSPFNDGPAAFSPSGDTICFTRNRAIGKRREAGSLGLFFAVRQGNSWSEPVPFAYNGDAYNTLHAAFGAQGQRLYFASDRPGGRGGMDLYSCTWDGSDWSEPVNLGPAVNSRSNEVYPNASPDGRLVYSSDRSGGAGKLDLYAALPVEGGWAKPQVMPAPLNSAGNDFGHAVHADGRSGYFSSDRDGADRIYRFNAEPTPFRNCAEEAVNTYCYHFEDAGAAQADTLPLRYEWDLGDGTRVAALSVDHCYDRPGLYEVRLDLIDTLSECIHANQVGLQLEVTDVEQPIIHGPDSAITGQSITMDTTHSHLPGFAAQAVHWDLGDSTFMAGAQAVHSYAAPGTYTVRLDLIGGPDGEGGFVNHCVFRNVVITAGVGPGNPVETPAANDTMGSGTKAARGGALPEQR